MFANSKIVFERSETELRSGAHAFRKHLLILVLLCLAVVFSVGCRPKLSGAIFLDENGNYKLDSGEKRLGDVAFDIVVANKEIGSGTSGSDGTYSFNISEKGRHCIRVNIEGQTPLVTIDSAPPSGKPVDKPLVKPEPPIVKPGIGVKEGLPGDQDGDGKIDSIDNCPKDSNANQLDTDKDGIGDVCDNCVNDKNKDQKNTDSDKYGDECDNCPKDKNDEQEDSDKDSVGDVCEKKSSGDSDNETVEIPPEYSSGEACISISKVVGSQALDVPISMQYKEPDASMDVSADVDEIISGSTGLVKFTFPCACWFVEDVELPEVLRFGKEWENGKTKIDVKKPNKISTFSASLDNITKPTFCEKTYELSTKYSEKDESITLNANIECPDKSTKTFTRKILLKSEGFPIEIDSAKLLTAIENLKPGKDINIQYKVVNRSGSSFEDVVFTLSASPLMITKAPDFCDKMGGSVECDFSLSAGKMRILQFTFMGPQKGNAFQEYKTEAELRIEDEEPILKQEVKKVITFTIPE